MSDRIDRRGNSWDRETPSPSVVPAFALNMWNPFLIGMTKSNGQSAEGYATLFSEWHNFVARRLQEDLLLAQRLTQTRTPDGIIAAYADFWQKAASDYAQEYSMIGKLLAGITSRMMSQAQSVTAEAAKPTAVARAA